MTSSVASRFTARSWVSHSSLALPHKWRSCSVARFRLLVGVMAAGQKAQRGSAIYFRAQNIEGVHASLHEKGVEFKTGPHVVNRSVQSETWLAEFVDPDGNQLALMSEKTIGGA